MIATGAGAGGHEHLRLPMVFSDEPGLAVDLYYRENLSSATQVEINLGGRFSEFGLPRGAARAPLLDIRCEFFKPSNLSRRIRMVTVRLDLEEVLQSYAQTFDEDAFDDDSTYLFQTTLSTDLEPGDYNLRVSLRDKELNIFSERTLFVTVPDMNVEGPGLGDLRFVTGWGETLVDGKVQVQFDPNPWRQVGPGPQRDLAVGFTLKGLVRWMAVVKRLRGGQERWSVNSSRNDEKVDGLTMIELPFAAMEDWKRGVYLLEVRAWPGPTNQGECRSAKTFELLP